MGIQRIGVTRIIAPSAVGSLKEELAPGHFVLPTQFLDFTKSRDGSFSENGRVIHISVADPFCPELQSSILKATENQDLKLFTKIAPMFVLKDQDFLQKLNQNSIEQQVQTLLA